MGENEWTSKNWHFIHQTLLLDEINIVWDQTLWSYWPLLHQSFTSLLCDLVYFLRQNASEPGLSNSLQPSIFFFIKFSRGIILSQNSTGLALYHCPAGKTILKVWSWLSGPQKVRLKPQKKKKTTFHGRLTLTSKAHVSVNTLQVNGLKQFLTHSWAIFVTYLPIFCAKNL